MMVNVSIDECWSVNQHGRLMIGIWNMLHSLNNSGIFTEVIDVQTLLTFDLSGTIVHSLKKTNRILFFDEDVPGGTTAYMMQEVLEKQRGYSYLDSQPATLASKEHRPAYGTDGNFWSKAEAEHVVEAIYAIMHEANPLKHPHIF